jgi:hypothetical protein
MTSSGPTVRLPTDVQAVNLGLPLFATAMRDQSIPVQQVDWRIPAGGDLVAVEALVALYGGSSSTAATGIDAANAEVVRRLDQGIPFLVDSAPAGDVVPGLTDRTLLHCGPAIGWDRVCDPLRRSMRAAVVAEGWAAGVADADRLLAAGEIGLEPANEHSTVVPMATAIGPSAPVYVVDNEAGGTRAFSPLNQGPGNVPWFGRDTPEAIAQLVFLREVASPILRRMISENGPIDVFALAAQGVQMGDDLHMRTQATTNLLIRNLLPFLPGTADPIGKVFAQYLSGDHLFFLNIAMAAAKSLTLWAEQVPGSSIVTTMARNGTDFGCKLAGDDAWYLTAAPPVGDALYYSGYGPEDAALDIGDSAVLELIGLGGPAAAGSPAVAAFLGGSMDDAARATQEMIDVCVAPSTRFKIPVMGFRGTPVGVDVRKIVETGITPKVNTGVLHRNAGVGQIGAGVATAPLDCFTEALLALTARLG